MMTMAYLIAALLCYIALASGFGKFIACRSRALDTTIGYAPSKNAELPVSGAGTIVGRRRELASL